MIYSISGILKSKKDQIVILETGGVGFKIRVPEGVLVALPEIGSTVSLYTHLHVREDALDLFGFLYEEELRLFESLNGVSGIGPKSALGIMGVAKIDQLVAAINEGKTDLLTRASGIGKKTAERLIVEMRDALSQWHAPAVSLSQTELIDPNHAIQDAISALTALGYKPHDAKNAVSKVHQPNHNNEQLIRLALQQIVRR